MVNKALKESAVYIEQRWGADKSKQIMALAEARYDALCQENNTAPKAVKTHTEGDIFPCMSLYQALQAVGVDAPTALSFLDEVWSKRAEAGAQSMAKLLKHFGLYKCYPAMFKRVAKKQFGTAAGFAATFYDCGKQHCKFDMTQCLFLDTCTRYGCPELTQCFCHVDDVNNAHLHPRLCWNRSQYMGGGGDHCDFDIFVTEDIPTSKR